MWSHSDASFGPVGEWREVSDVLSANFDRKRQIGFGIYKHSKTVNELRWIPSGVSSHLRYFTARHGADSCLTVTVSQMACRKI